MKKISGILCLITFVLCFSCEKPFFVKCSECLSYEPVNVKLNITIDMNFNGLLDTEITVYEGNIESGIVFEKFTATGTSTYSTVTINKKYTLTARYHFADGEYIAVNSVYPRTQYTTNACNDPCYFIYDRDVNLKLRRH